MIDLAKSMFRFSWALSVFGARQAVGLVTRGRDESSSVADLEAVRYAAEGQMDGTVRSLFNAGDRMQRAMVDLAASAFNRTVDTTVNRTAGGGRG